MKIEGKNSIMLFFVFLYLPSIALFLLSGSRNLSDYVSTSFYVILGVVCLVILGTVIKSDDKYYKNFSAPYLLAAVITGLGMIGLSWTLSDQLKNPNMLLSVNQAFSVPGMSVSTLTLTSMPTSVSTFFLSAVLSGLVLAALSEELLKLTMFAEGKERWGKGYRIGKILVPGVLIYVGFPVGFWAAMHGISAYSNPVMILPAAVNGIILIILLWKTECILACIFAHWLYNSGILVLTYLNGTANVPSGMPFIPNPFSSGYWSNSGFISDFLIVGLLIAAVFFFLLPSLTAGRKGKR